MRIALVRRKIDCHGGGAERYAARLSRRLVQHGHEITLICQYLEAELRSDELRVIEIPPIRAPRWTKAAAFAELASAACNQNSFDLVFGLSALPCADLVRVSEGVHRHYLEMRYGSSWLGQLQRVNPRHRALMQLEHAVFGASQRQFIVQCQLDRFLLHHHFAQSDDNIHVLSNGVDTDFFCPPQMTGNLPRENGRLRVLFAAASNFGRKGLRELIQAIAILRHPDVQLQVAGPLQPAFVRLAREWRVADRVKFIGLRTDMPDLYREADLTVAPSIYEPFPNVVLESLACGTPVLTTTNTGAAELIQHQRNGWLIGSTKPGEIAAGVEWLANTDDQTRRNIRRHCRETSLCHRWCDHFANLEDSIAALRFIGLTRSKPNGIRC